MSGRAHGRRRRPVLTDDDVVGASLGHLQRLDRDAGSRSCRSCGCTDRYACDGSCWWVEGDLCSSCAPVPVR